MFLDGEDLQREQKKVGGEGGTALLDSVKCIAKLSSYTSKSRAFYRKGLFSPLTLMLASCSIAPRLPLLPRG